MTKKLLLTLPVFILSIITGWAQTSTLIANKVQVKDSLKIGGKWYSKFPDSLVGVNDTTALARKANNLSDLTNIPAARANLLVDHVDNTSDAEKNGATVELFNHTINGANNTLSNIPFSALLGAVPNGRNITINGVTYDLSADRSWTISGGTGGVSNYAALSDVNVVGILNKQIARWDSIAAKWTNFTPALADISLWAGYKPLSKTDTLNGATNTFLNVPFSALIAKPTTLSAYGITDAVSTARTLTINGTAFDLSANRTWTLPLGSTTYSGLTDVTITSPVLGQLNQYNGSKWVNFTPNLATITLWAGYKPFGPGDTLNHTLVTQKVLNDSFAAVDTMKLKTPLYWYNTGTDSGLGVHYDLPTWNANQLQSIPLSATAPADGQVPTYDAVSNTIKFKTPSAGGSSYTFPTSVKNSSGAIALDGDAATPGNWFIYGTDGSGTKHFNSFTGYPVTTASSNGLFPSSEKARLDSGLAIANRRVSGADSLLYAVLSGVPGIYDSLYARALQLVGSYGLNIVDSSTQAVIKKIFSLDSAIWTTRARSQAGRDSIWLVLQQKANLASPTFTGTPIVPTATPGTNTTQAASTAFVQAAVAASSAGVSSFAGRTGAVSPASGDYTVAQVTGAAPISSPTFTGSPAVPTATAGTNTTQAASTAFVQSAVSSATSGLAPIASPTFTGSPAVPTATAGTSTTQAASTAFVQAAVSSATTGLAPIASPSFTGTPAVPTATAGTNTTQAASTAFVQAAVAAASAGVSSFAGRTGAVSPTSGDYSVAQVTGAAPIASPTFTGTPAVPTATAGTNTTQAASTAFVQSAVSTATSPLAPKASPTFTGTPIVPTAAPGTNTTQAASTAFVQAAVAASGAGVSSFAGRTGAVSPASGDYSVAQVTGAAPIASPTFTGTPAVPTATAGTNTTQAASTAFVQAAVSSATSGLVTSFAGRGGAVSPASGDYSVGQVTGAAPLASPALTGTPTVPTATAGTNTTQAASTAFVQSAVSAATGAYPTLWQQILSGTSGVVNSNVGNVVFVGFSGLGSYTLTMPPSPADGLTISIYGNPNFSPGTTCISSFSIVGNSGQSIMMKNPPTTFVSGDVIVLRWSQTLLTWFGYKY